MTQFRFFIESTNGKQQSLFRECIFLNFIVCGDGEHWSNCMFSISIAASLGGKVRAETLQ